MDSTKEWLPDEGFFSNPAWMTSIKAHIRAYMLKLANSDMDMKDENFLGPFSKMLLQFERSPELRQKKEALTFLQGMWDEFTNFPGFVAPPFPISPPPSKIYSKFSCYKMQNKRDG